MTDDTQIISRRTIIGGASAALLTSLAACGSKKADAPAENPSKPAAIPKSSSDAPANWWSYDRFVNAMKESGRKHSVSAEQFAEIQSRKPAAMALIKEYLEQRLGSADPNVLRAFNDLPREYYHYFYPGDYSTAIQAYEPEPKPFALGYGSALSDYLGQAYMTQVSGVGPESVTLEIGTGSGYQSSVLSRMVKKAYSIEIIQPLGEKVGKIFKPLGLDNIETRVGDGYFGWPEVKDGFDLIIVTCAAQYAPPELFKQLKPGGRMVIPIGQPFKRGQVLYIYNKDEDGKIRSKRDVGVFFIPMTGAMMKKPKPA